MSVNSGLKGYCEYLDATAGPGWEQQQTVEEWQWEYEHADDPEPDLNDLQQFLNDEDRQKMRWKDTGGDFELVEPGTHLAICFRVVDLGTQPSNNPKYSPRKQCFISWEVCGTEAGETGKPLTIGKFYSQTISARSNLGKDLVSWRGRPFTEQELEGFDPRAILGKPCLISVSHERKNDKDRANVDKVSKILKGQDVPAQIHPNVYFEIDNWNKDVFEDLPEFLRDMINRSFEVTGGPEADKAVQEYAPGAMEGEPDDDVPF